MALRQRNLGIRLIISWLICAWKRKGRPGTLVTVKFNVYGATREFIRKHFIDRQFLPFMVRYVLK